MQKKLAIAIITVLSLWIYVAVTLEFNNLAYIPKPVYGLILAVLLIGAYGYTVVRSLHSYNKRTIEELQQKYEVVYVGIVLDSKVAVTSSSRGITIFDLGAEGKAIQAVRNIPFANLKLVPKDGYNLLSDRGNVVQIKQNNDNWMVTASLMTAEQAKKITVVSYLLSRFNKSQSNAEGVVKNLLAPASNSSSATETTVTDQDSGVLFKKFADDSSVSVLRLQIGTIIGTFVGVGLAVIASLATSAVIDPDYRRELSAPFTTCAQDSSKIKTVPINQSIETNSGAKITLHTVRYNVPQDSKKPQDANNWYCAKATFVEVTVDNIPSEDGSDKIRIYDFSLETEGARQPGKVSDIGANTSAEESYVDYTKRNNLDELKLRLPEGVTTSRGWLTFSVTENAPNESVRLLFTESDKTVHTVTLPNSN